MRLRRVGVLFESDWRNEDGWFRTRFQASLWDAVHPLAIPASETGGLLSSVPPGLSAAEGE